MFFPNSGLDNPIIIHGSWLYYAMMAPFTAVQLITIQVFFKLKSKPLHIAHTPIQSAEEVTTTTR
ncbi:MAG: hypothetical protein ACYC3A_01920 [Halothiobacillus sp.]